MSLLASLFALNIESLPHDSGNLSYPSEWIFPRICMHGTEIGLVQREIILTSILVGTAAAIAVPLVLITVYIIKFHEALKLLWGFLACSIKAVFRSNKELSLQDQEDYSNNRSQNNKRPSHALRNDPNQTPKSIHRPQSERYYSDPSWKVGLRREKSSPQDSV